MASFSTFEMPALEYGETLAAPTRFEFAEIIHRYFDRIHQLEGITVDKVPGGEGTVTIPRKVCESVYDSFLRFSVAKTEPLEKDILKWGRQMVLKNDVVTITERNSHHLADTLRHLIRGHVYCDGLSDSFENVTDAMLRMELGREISARADGARLIFETIGYLTKEFDRMSEKIINAKLEIQESKQELEEAKRKLERSTRHSKSAQPNSTRAAILASQTEAQISKLRAEKDVAVSDLASANLLISRFNAAPNPTSSQHSEYDKIIENQRYRYTQAVETYRTNMQNKDNELKVLKSQLAKLKGEDTGMGKQSSTDQGKAAKDYPFLKEQISLFQNENEELRAESAALKDERNELQVFKDNINFPNQDGTDTLRRQVEDLQESLNAAHEKSRGDEEAKKYAIEMAVSDALLSQKENLRKKDGKIRELRDGVLDLETGVKKAFEAAMAANEKAKELRVITG